MSNVVNLRAAERLIWQCGQCGCTTFYLYNDETAECAVCSNVSEGSEWVMPLRDAPIASEKDDAGSHNRIAYGSSGLARRRVMKKIEDFGDGIALVAGWNRDGASSAWSDFETEEQKAWVVRKLRELADSYEKQALDDA